MSTSTWCKMSMDDLITMRDKILQSNNCTSSYQRMVLYLGMVLADRMIQQGDLVMGEEELQMCTTLIQREEGVSEEEQKMLLHDLRKVKFLQLEVSVLGSQFSRGLALRLELSSLVDPDCVSHFAFLCYSAGQELLRLGRQVEARDWLRSVLQVDSEYKITEIRDASVKLLIKMAVKDEVEEDDVLNMVELLSSPHDQLLARLDLSTHGILSHPQLPSTLAMSFSQVLDLLAMSHNSPRKVEMLEWLLTCPWQGLSPSQQEDCLAKMIYSGRKLVLGLAFSAISKYIELVTSAGAEVGKSVGMVLEVGDQAVQALGIEDRLDKMEEWLKALAFLSSVSGKDDHFHHFAESFVVLLINQERIPEAVSFLALWRKTVKGYNVTREQLEMMVFLISGNCKGVVELLQRMLEEKEVREEEVGQSLRLLMVDLVEKKKLDPDTMEQLLKSLADRQFFLSLELTKFAVKVAVSMNRYQLVADILSQGKVKDWLVEKDEDCFLSKLCWDVGLSCDSLLLKHSLLLLSGQLLPSSDPAGLAACLASVPAGLMAVKRMDGRDMEQFMRQLEEVLVMLEKQGTSWGMQRTVLLYRFQLCLLANKDGDKLSEVVDQMASLGDKKGLEAVSVMVARVEKFSMDPVAVKALMKAQVLEKDQVSKERRGVAILEVMARHPDWWKTCQVVEVVRGLDWTEGDMMGEAVKLVWNSWVVLKKDTGGSMETGWGKALVWLHNLATEATDHITCNLDQPTITLLRKVRRVARGHMVGESV